MFFPEWERQGKIKGAKERKESGEGEEQEFKRQKKLKKKHQNMNVSHSSTPSGVESETKEEENIK